MLFLALKHHNKEGVIIVLHYQFKEKYNFWQYRAVSIFYNYISKNYE